MSEMVKFFCIGVFRSGTSSTREYLKSMGMKAVGWSVIASNYRNYPHNTGPVYQTLGEYDVFGDIPYNYMEFIDRMIREYPDALFFLSTRDESSWMESIKRHRAVRVEGVSNLITKGTLERVGVTGTSDEDMKKSYVARNAKVIAMFERNGASDRLCTFSIDNGEMKSKIDDFLVGRGLVLEKGVDHFPWAEKTT